MGRVDVVLRRNPVLVEQTKVVPAAANAVEIQTKQEHQFKQFKVALNLPVDAHVPNNSSDSRNSNEFQYPEQC